MIFKIQGDKLPLKDFDAAIYQWTLRELTLLIITFAEPIDPETND
jgi:hypothetical protein